MRNIIIVAFFIVSCVRSCKQMRYGGSSHGHWQPTNFRFQAIGAGTSVALIAQCLALQSVSAQVKANTMQLSMSSQPQKNRRLTNTVTSVVNGIRHKRLGCSDIVVSEIGLGTQRWCR